MNNFLKYMITVKKIEKDLNCKDIIACLDICAAFDSVNHQILIQAGIERVRTEMIQKENKNILMIHLILFNLLMPIKPKRQ